MPTCKKGGLRLHLIEKRKLIGLDQDLQDYEFTQDYYKKSILVDKRKVKDIKQACEKSTESFFVCCLAVYAFSLIKSFKKERFYLSFTYDVRPNAFEKTLGAFARSMYIPVNVSAAITFSDLLAVIRNGYLKTLSYGDVFFIA